MREWIDMRIVDTLLSRQLPSDVGTWLGGAGGPLVPQEPRTRDAGHSRTRRLYYRSNHEIWAAVQDAVLALVSWRAIMTHFGG